MITCTFEDRRQAKLRHAVVDTIILNQQQTQVLLVKRAPTSLLEANKYALPGGFVEHNETTAQAARRETLEETGYTVTTLKLFKIIDDPRRQGEDRQNISFLFTATAKTQLHPPDHEITHITWFPLKKLPPKSQIAFDHHQALQSYLQCTPPKNHHASK